MRVLSPEDFYNEEKIYAINTAYLTLKNGLLSKRIARTPAEITDAELKVKEAQQQLASLYIPYLSACRKGGFEAMRLADVAEELKIYNDEED